MSTRGRHRECVIPPDAGATGGKTLSDGCPNARASIESQGRVASEWRVKERESLNERPMSRVGRRWWLLLAGAGLAAVLASCDPPPPDLPSSFTPPFVGTVQRSQFFE